MSEMTPMTTRSRRHPSRGAGGSPVAAILSDHLGDAAPARLDEGERLYARVLTLRGHESAVAIIERAAQAWARGSAFEVPWLSDTPLAETDEPDTPVTEDAETDMRVQHDEKPAQ